MLQTEIKGRVGVGVGGETWKGTVNDFRIVWGYWDVFLGLWKGCVSGVHLSMQCCARHFEDILDV